MTELLSVEEVAKLLNLHEMTVRRHIRRGALQAVKVGGRIRLRAEDVERFLLPVRTPVGAIPPAAPPCEAEIARRRALFEETMRLRAEIGPIGITTGELVHLGREEEAAD